MKRREMIIKAVQAGAALSFVTPLQLISKTKNSSGLSELTGNPLRFPPVFANGGTMTLANSVVNVWPGQNTNVIAVNGSYPGPSVVIQKGDTFTAHFVNNLTEPATAHWHGISAPELMDGHPKDAIEPGNSFTYTFPVLNRAGTYFYHAHADMLTSKHVYKGFAGFFIVDDTAEISLGLPRGQYDVPLCLQDRRLADIPEFNYNPSITDMTRGFLGNTVLVNGTPDAYFEVSKTLYRFRLLNGSNARVYKIALSNNSPFKIIATDGGLKEAPAEVTSFFLSPGERVDILVDFSSYSLGDSLILKTLTFPSSGGGIYRQGVEMNLLRFDVTGSGSSGGIVPAALTPIDFYNPSDAVTVRDFVLSMVGGGIGMHRINGLSFEMDRIDWETPVDTLEEWKIINTTNQIHPMHSHATLFQVYSRNGSTSLPPSDIGWKDTVLVNPSETVRILVKFKNYTGTYLFHCHNLEHEDDGMMLNFKIIDNPLPVELSAFTAIVNNRDVTLNWVTSSEKNNSGFEVEKSYVVNENNNGELLNWEKTGFVKGKGNSNDIENYSFNAGKLNSGKYKFRLKQIDFNGNFNYYYLQNEVVIGNPDKFYLHQNYPNPFNPDTKISFDIPDDGNVVLKVYNNTGREVKTLINGFKNKGYYTMNFNSESLSSGIYYCRLNAGKFTQTIKMILNK